MVPGTYDLWPLPHLSPSARRLSHPMLTFSVFSASHSRSKANSSLLRFVHREPSRSPARGQSACAMAVSAGLKLQVPSRRLPFSFCRFLLFAEYHNIIHLSSNLVLKYGVRGFSRFTPCATVPASPHSTGGPENTEAYCSLKHMPAL